MNITPATLVADIATASPATIKVFQRHRIDFCCGGKVPLSVLCARQKLDTATLIAELDAARGPLDAEADWNHQPLHELVTYIQSRFHRPLVEELPRLRAMVDKVVSRHGDRLPEVLLPLQRTFADLQSELLEHMAKEDAVLFPAVTAIEAGRPVTTVTQQWIHQPIHALEMEHASAGAALERMAALTDGYTPPEDACPTFRGLYYGLAELEREMHVHVHLENNVLFPRTLALVASRAHVTS
jgi:regulator of cell morphogenesis and NO signaling